MQGFQYILPDSCCDVRKLCLLITCLWQLYINQIFTDNSWLKYWICAGWQVLHHLDRLHGRLRHVWGFADLELRKFAMCKGVRILMNCQYFWDVYSVDWDGGEVQFLGMYMSGSCVDGQQVTVWAVFPCKLCSPKDSLVKLWRLLYQKSTVLYAAIYNFLGILVIIVVGEVFRRSK